MCCSAMEDVYVCVNKEPYCCDKKRALPTKKDTTYLVLKLAKEAHPSLINLLNTTYNNDIIFTVTI